MKYGEYEITCSPYIKNIVAPADGESKEAALEDVLTYHTEKVLEQHNPAERKVVSLARFLSKPVPELAAFVDPDSKTVFFGTEAEVQSRMDGDGQV